MSVDETTTDPAAGRAAAKKELVEQATLLGIIRRRVNQAYNDVTGELVREGHVTEGETVRPVLGSIKLGAVLIPQRLPHPEVTDSVALLNWVATHYPHFVIDALDPGFLKLLKVTGDASMVVGPGGEVDVPGVGVGYGAAAPRATVRNTAAADEDEVLYELLAKYRPRFSELLSGADEVGR